MTIRYGHIAEEVAQVTAPGGRRYVVWRHTEYLGSDDNTKEFYSMGKPGELPAPGGYFSLEAVLGFKGLPFEQAQKEARRIEKLCKS